MASGQAVRVQGLDELRGALKAADAKLPRELGKANKTAAGIVADEAKRRAPAGPHQGGGSIKPIRASIRALSRAKAAAVQIGGVSTPHAQVYEFGGTLRRYHSSSRTLVRAQPYLYPAIGAKQDEVRDAYGELLDDLMRRAFPDPV